MEAQDRPYTTDVELETILEEITAAIRTGQTVSIDRFIEQWPQHADRLRDLMGAMQMLVHFGVEESVTDGSQTHQIECVVPSTKILGDFRILHEVGRGGMGVVYEAEQISLDRRVALKIFPFASILDERQLQRFKNEARAVATLNHTNIVPIYFVGVEHGVHFYAMQFVQGQSLAAVLQGLRQEEVEVSAAEPRPSANKRSVDGDSTRPVVQAQLSTQRSHQRDDYFRSIAKLGVEVAEGLQHAHEHGIIHRDIKPSNLMLDSTGHCLITDFGLARLEGDETLTVSGDIVGTLRYAPPEQVLGQQSVVDHRADIYALGATLYELLSLKPAMDESNREALLQQVTRGNPKSLRSIDATIPQDLETIVHRAIEHDPADRYESAETLAEDLRRFRAHRTLVSQRPGLSQRASKWVKRHPKVVIKTVGVLLLFVSTVTVAAIALNHQRVKTTEQRDEARSNLRLAISALNEVYHEIGSNWIDRDRNLSDTQTHFLLRSAELLTEIANRFPPETQFYADAGLAHLHAANANARLLQFDKAQIGYEDARKLLTKAIAEQPSDRGLRESVVSTDFYLANLFVAAWQFDEARLAYTAAAEQSRHLLALAPASEEVNAGLIAIEIDLLRLNSLDLQNEKVVRVGSQLRAQVHPIVVASPRRTTPHRQNLRLACLVSRSLRRLGRPNEALNLCEETLTDSATWLRDYRDHREITRIVAATQAELGRCQLELSQYAAAEASLHSALSRLRESFIFDATPKEFSFAYMREEVTHDQMEPAAFAQYARTQAALAQLLLATERHDEAYVLADESVRTCHALIGLFPKLPEYVANAAECILVLLEVDGLDANQNKSRMTQLMDVAAELKTHVERGNVPREYARSYSKLESEQARLQQPAAFRSEAGLKNK